MLLFMDNFCHTSHLSFSENALWLMYSSRMNVFLLYHVTCGTFTVEPKLPSLSKHALHRKSQFVSSVLTFDFVYASMASNETSYLHSLVSCRILPVLAAHRSEYQVVACLLHFVLQGHRHDLATQPVTLIALRKTKDCHRIFYIIA